MGASDAYANLALRQRLHGARLEARDAAFATELVMGVLRHRGTLDAILAAVTDRPLAKLDPRVLDVLRMGAYQLLYLHTQPHAAVDTSVDLVGDVAGPAPKGLVNAVLRKVGASDLDGWLTRLTSGLSAVDALSLRTSHPRWIASSLRDALGGADEALAALLEHDNLSPAVTLVARPGRITRGDLAAAAAAATPGRWSPYALRLDGGAPGAIAAVRDQRAAVQDEGSQLVADLLARVPLDGADEHWLDLCAGPGGKSGLLAALAAQRDADLVAVEPKAARARLVARTLADSPGEQLVVQADGRDGPWKSGTFDRVLVDAPCTGLGVLRRRPEARWRRRPADLPLLTALQRDLLNAAVSATRPGGVIVYATCSPHLAETDLVIDDLLVSRSDVVELDAVALADEPLRATLGTGPRWRLWPHVHDTDGMFAAVLRRSGDANSPG